MRLIIRRNLAFAAIVVIVTFVLGFLWNIIFTQYQDMFFLKKNLQVFLFLLLIIYFISIEGVRLLLYKYWPVQDIDMQNIFRNHAAYSKKEELKRRLPAVYEEITKQFAVTKAGIVIKSVDYLGEEVVAWPPHFGFTTEILTSIKEMRNKFGPVILSQNIAAQGYDGEYRKLQASNIQAVLYLEEKRMYKGFILLGLKKDGGQWSSGDIGRLTRLQKDMQRKVAEIVFYQLTFKRLEKMGIYNSKVGK